MKRKDVFTYEFNDGSGRSVKLKVGSVVDGVRITKEMADGIKKAVHDSIQNDRDYADMVDLKTEFEKQRVENSNDDFDVDPIDNLPTESGEYEWFIRGKYSRIELIKLVDEVLPKLPPNRRELYEILFVGNTTQTELARQRGVCKQAINKQRTKMLKLFLEILDEAGIDDDSFHARG